MFLIGVFLFLLVGISLGLLGAGGTIVAVPILVYLFKIDKVEAAVYSFFIVAIAALSGAIQYIKHKLFKWNVLFWFCIPSVVGIFLSRRIFLPHLPNLITITHDIVVSKGTIVMLLFSVLMMLSAFNMLKAKKEISIENENGKKIKPAQTIAIGLFTGIVVGFVGAGGGFIIVPALIYFMRLSMKEAVGNSLMVIFINSTIGFLIDTHDKATLQWQLIISFSIAAIVGMVIGIFLSQKISNQILKKIFGWFVLLMGVYIIYNELMLTTK